MAAGTSRAIAMATTNSSSSLFTKNAFFMNHKQKLFPYNNTLCLKNLKFAHPSPKRSYTCRAVYNPEVLVKEEGQPETLDYRVFLVDNSGKKVSPWHDIPLWFGDGVFNYVVEIPKESGAKMEVATMNHILPQSRIQKRGSFDITSIIYIGTMAYFRKPGKTHPFLTLRLKEHLEIMIQLMWLRLVKDGGK